MVLLGNRDNQNINLRNQLEKNFTDVFVEPISIITEHIVEMSKSDVTEEEMFYIKVAMENVKRLNRMIGNLYERGVELSILSKGERKLCDLVQVSKEVIIGMEPYIKEKGLQVVFYSEVSQLIYLINSVSFEHIMMNLLSNAIKYTNKCGIINVYLHLKHEYIHVHVMDNGKGIEEGRLNKVFNYFNCEESTEILREKGSGIGLCTTRNLVESLGGQVTVRSRRGVGSEFIVVLPIDTSQKVYNNKSDINFTNIYYKAYGGDYDERLHYSIS